MNMRTLGNLDTQVSPIMLGGNVFGWTIDEPQSFAILDHFADRGFNFIDTADMYATWVSPEGGQSETILGNWFRRSGKRSTTVIATKLGQPMPDGKGLGAAYMKTAVELSLRRLQTDYIDLYQAHLDDFETPQEETLRAFDDLVHSGKVRAIGASNYGSKRLRAAIEIARNAGWASFQTLQPNYNLYTREKYEGDLAPVVAEFSLGVIPYYSLAAGFLTGKYRNAEEAARANRAGTLANFFNDRGARILAALASVASQTGARQATVALAWLLSRPNVLAPIVSATTTPQLDEILAAADLQLTPEQLSELSSASAYPVSSAAPAMAGALPAS